MTLLNLEPLLERLSRWEEDRLARLLRARPDLLHQAPGDLTVLAIRMSSETSIRAHLQRLDAPTLRVLRRLTRAAAADSASSAAEVEFSADVESAADAESTTEPEAQIAASLESAGLIFAAEESSDPADTDPRWETLVRMPHILDSLDAQFPQLAGLIGAPHPEPESGTISAAMVENASLSVVSDLLDDVAELLGLLSHAPAATLRTGGVGMRELRRIAAQTTRWGTSVGVRRSGGAEPGLGATASSDASVGEIGWLLELTASCGLLELNDSQAWAPGLLAEQWSVAAREHQHQLLVSGWLIAPRAPMLLRGPHPTSRIAPTLALDRQRGDAAALRRVLLQTAQELIPDAEAPRRLLYSLDLPEDDLPGADALQGALLRRLAWERPLLSARVGHLLPWLVREAERLGLFAVGTLSAAGQSLLGSGASAAVPEPVTAETPWAEGLTRLARQLGGSLPAQVDTLLVQSDLTAIATGSLSAPSATALSEFAQREGHGAVPTFRFSTESLHRGLTRGWTAQSMLSWLQAHSVTSLPSSLSTQITDAARSWRGVQIAPAGAWLRVTDAEQRDALMQHPELSGLGLHVVGEDVLICEASPAALEQALTAAGFNSAHTANVAPAQNRDSGAPMLGSSPEHTASWSLESSPWEQSRVTSPNLAEPDAGEIAAAAATLRRAGLAAPSSDSAVASDVVGTLRSALAARRTVTLTRVSPQGSTHHVTGVPTGMNAGRVRIRVREDEGEAVVMLHRIASVEESGAQTSHEGDR